MFIPIAVASIAFRPSFVPYETKPAAIFKGNTNLIHISVEDLDGDGVDEIIKTINNDFSVYNQRGFNPRRDLSNTIKMLLVDNFDGENFIFRSELNSTLAILPRKALWAASVSAAAGFLSWSGFSSGRRW